MITVGQLRAELDEFDQVAQQCSCRADHRLETIIWIESTTVYESRFSWIAVQAHEGALGNKYSDEFEGQEDNREANNNCKNPVPGLHPVLGAV